MDPFYIKLIVAIAVIAIVFGILWKQGQLLRLANYFQETKEELKKCTWPSRDELKGSTVVVLLSILLLGVFTVGVDLILTLFINGVVQ